MQKDLVKPFVVKKASGKYPLFLPDPKTPRSPGLHVSNIIRCIATEAGILKPEWAEEVSLVDVRTITDPLAILRISIGLAWESYFIPEILSHYGVIDHPGEMEYEGVYMTHDGEDLSAIIALMESREAYRWELRIHEVKATYKSTKTVGEELEGKNWMWLAQIMAYCKAKGTRFAVLHVLFLCGNYKYPLRPMLESWEIEFSQAAIDSNWELLDDYRRQAQQIDDDNMRGFGE